MTAGRVRRLSDTSEAFKILQKQWWTSTRESRAKPSTEPQTQSSRQLSSNVFINTTNQIWIQHDLLVRLGQEDHVATTTKQIKQMSRRGIHPLLMGLDKPKPVLKPKPKPAEEKQPDLSGYESAQRKRFLRAEAEEAKQEDAQARRRLLNLERQS